MVENMEANLKEAIKKMSVQERIKLAEEIWNSVAEDSEAFTLTGAQKEELDKRIESFPKNGVPVRSWDEIKAEFLGSANLNT